jgi:hypothetical protein
MAPPSRGRGRDVVGVCRVTPGSHRRGTGPVGRVTVVEQEVRARFQVRNRARGSFSAAGTGRPVRELPLDGQTPRPTTPKPRPATPDASTYDPHASTYDPHASNYDPHASNYDP